MRPREKKITGYLKMLTLMAVLSLVPPTWVRAEGENSRIAFDEKGFLAITYPLKSTTLSTDVAGKIKTITYDMGETFKKGEPLIVIDADYFNAEREKAAATAAYSDALWLSKKQLFAQKSVSTLEYTRARADDQISKANLAIAQKKMEACVIRAPYDGKVVKRMAREDEFVAEGQPLLEIIDDRVVRAKFHLPSALYANTKVGQVHAIQIQNIMLPFECKITHISPVVESNTSTFQVFAEIDNLQNSIRPGMTGYVMMDIKKDDSP